MCDTGGISGFGICQDDEPYQNFGIEGDWNFGNYEQVFGLTANHSQKLHDIITKTVFTQSTAGASSGGEYYQEHRVPSLMGFKSHDYPPGPENSSSQSPRLHSSRDSAVLRYKEKKKTRKYAKASSRILIPQIIHVY